MKSLVLTGRVKGWATDEASYNKLMGDYEHDVWQCSKFER